MTNVKMIKKITGRMMMPTGRVTNKVNQAKVVRGLEVLRLLEG